MSDTLEKLKVVIEADAAPLQNAAKRVISTSRDMAQQINRSIHDISTAPVEKKVRDTLSMTQNWTRTLKSTLKDAVNGNLVQSLVHEVKSYAKEAQVSAGIKVYTEDYRNLCADIEETRDMLEKLKEKRDAFSNSDKFEVSKAFKDVEKNISSAESQLEKLLASQEKMKSSGKDTVPIRKEPSASSASQGYTGKGTFTIVETDGNWGLLKSYQSKRNGWISLDYAKRV